jgi:transcriptional regulator with XRE-family HTH domain
MLIPEFATTGELALAIGRRLRDQRLAQNVTLRELAKRSGLSVGALRKMEIDGKTTLYSLIRVVQALGLGSELAHLFELKQRSIAEMEAAAQASQRQRASGAWTA